MIKTDFALIKHHGYTQYDLNHMMPFVRKIHILLLIQHLKEVENAQKGNDNVQETMQWNNNESIEEGEIQTIMDNLSSIPEESWVKESSTENIIEE